MTDKDVHNPDKKLVDPSERAARVLDQVISEEEAISTEVPKEAVVETGDERYIEGSDRQYIRVLMISTDRAIFAHESPSQIRAQSLASIFEEVHIIVLTDRIEDLRPLRLAPNVWAYPTNSRTPFLYPYDAYTLAKRQLSFADGFRPDAVSAENPFAAGLAAYVIARRFKRALQIELHVNPFESSFIDAHPHNKWLSLLAGFLIPRATTVRAISETLKLVVTKRYPKQAERVESLPVFSDVSFFRDAQRAFDLHLEYPLFKFIVLMVSPLTKDSAVEDGIAACAPILAQYPTVGLVIVGDGVERPALEKKVADMYLQNQVIFRGDQSDLLSHFKTANVLLNTARNERYDEVLAQSAAAGLSIISTDVGFAHDFIENDVNGFLCPAGDIACLSQKIEEFLSNNQLRVLFAKTAQDKIIRIVAANIDGYFGALQYSLEQCVVRYGGTQEPEPHPPTQTT